MTETPLKRVSGLLRSIKRFGMFPSFVEDDEATSLKFSHTSWLFATFWYTVFYIPVGILVYAGNKAGKYSLAYADLCPISVIGNLKKNVGSLVYIEKTERDLE